MASSKKVFRFRQSKVSCICPISVPRLSYQFDGILNQLILIKQRKVREILTSFGKHVKDSVCRGINDAWFQQICSFCEGILFFYYNIHNPFPNLLQLQAQEQIQLLRLVLTMCIKKASGHDHSESFPLKGSG